MAKKCWLLLLSVSLIWQLGVRSQPLPDNWQQHIQTFYTQARTDRTPRPETQHATLTLSDENGFANMVYLAREQDENGNPYVFEGANTDNRYQCIPTPENAINYLVARPDGERHAEEALLSGLPTMLNNYNNHFGRQPQVVTLFSWLMPCNDARRGHNCRQQIVDTFNRLLNSARRIVAYNRPNIPDANIFNDLMRTNRIDAYGPFNFDHPDYRPNNCRHGGGNLRRQLRQDAESFQECLIRHLTPTLSNVYWTNLRDLLELFVDQVLGDLANRNVLGSVDRMKSGAASWIRENVDANARGLNLGDLEKSTNDSLEICLRSKLHYASPFSVCQSTSDIDNEVCPASILSLVRSDVIENKQRALCDLSTNEGVLCSRFRPNKISVNGEFVNGVCSRNGQMYSWGQITGYKPIWGWDYCCETPCINGKCNGGDGLINCGSPGWLTVHGRPCRSDHPCGLHGYKYYWCYMDDGDWQFCCWTKNEKCSRQSDGKDMCDVWQRGDEQLKMCGGKTKLTIKKQRCRDGHPCSTHGENYFWCYTDSRGNWEFCCNPYHQCGTHGKTYNWCYTNDEGDGRLEHCTP